MTEETKAYQCVNEKCLGCESKIQGRFCHNCGQMDLDKDITIRALFQEWVDERFGLDGKAWRTLFVLFTKPGFLTEAFIRGQRAQYIRPVRLLFTFIISFVLLSSSFNITFLSFDPKVDKDSGDLDIGGDFGIHRQESCMVPRDVFQKVQEKIDSMINEKTDFNDKPAKDTTEGRIFVQHISQNSAFLLTDKCYVNKQIYSSLLNATWAFIPFFAFMLRIFYRKQKKTLLQSLIHACHLHSVMFVLLILIILGFLIAGFISWQAQLFALFYFWLYILLSCRKVYGGSWVKLFIKTNLIIWTYWTVCFGLITGLWVTWFVGGFEMLYVNFFSISKNLQRTYGYLVFFFA